MSQLISLSDKAQSLVKNYVDRYIAKNAVDATNDDGRILYRLSVSIYARTENADTAVLDALGKYIIDLSDYFSDDEVATLLAEAPALITYCHEHILSYKSSDAGDEYKITECVYEDWDSQVPKSIGELCSKMAKCKPGSHISFYMPNGCVYDMAKEIKEFEAYSKIMFTFPQGIFSKIDWQWEKEHDYKFSRPPMRLSSDLAKTFLYLAQHALNDRGELYCLLPTSFCYDDVWCEFRKKLFKESGNAYSATVIELFPMSNHQNPTLFYHPLCLLCLKKDGKGIITLMDASDYAFLIASKDQTGVILDFDKVIKALTNQDKEYVWVGKTIDLPDDADIYPSRYLVKGFLPKPNDEGVLCKLSEFISFVPYEKMSQEEIPMVSMKELSMSYLDCVINRDELLPHHKVGHNCLTPDCMFIGYDWRGFFKVGRVNGVSETTPIVFPLGIEAVKLKTNTITEDFLLRCIMSESAKIQAECMTKKLFLFTQTDLLSITVWVPKRLSEQERLCREDAKRSLVEANLKLQKNAESFRKDMHTKMHNIGQTIFNLTCWIEVLNNARKDGNGIVDDNAVIGPNETVADIYESLQSIIEELQTKISNFDSGNGMQRSKIDLIDFIEEYCRKPENRYPIFQYKVDAKAHRAQETIRDENNEIVANKGDALESVIFPKEGLNRIFDNIISNACAHGFENKTNNPNNKVKFEIKHEGETCVVEISNNGDPLLSNYNPEEVLTYGISSKEGKEGHFGLGGAEVRNIMQEFDGDVEFISNPKDEFPVTYRLIFENPNIINPNSYGKY